jgi:hypothetical protein
MKSVWFITFASVAVALLSSSLTSQDAEQIVRSHDIPLNFSADANASDDATAPAGDSVMQAVSSSDSADKANYGKSFGVGVIPLPTFVEPSGVRAPGVQWKALMHGSLLYLGSMHSFRLVTEAGTRQGLHNSVIGGYFKALGAMHGWSDGDGYFENYLGHPIEGAVAGYMWIHNDPRYREVQFGADRDYWMSRLRAYAFAWAFSEQFEIGPISEASIGQIQRYCCAYGFVDHVITPNGGMVWMVAGDAIDRFVTIPLENHTHSAALRVLARSVLNPPQTFANLMMFQYPWHRENRGPAADYDRAVYLRHSRSLSSAVSSDANVGDSMVPKFELTATLPSIRQVGGLACIGGGGIGAFRVTEFWQWTVEVSGCTLGNSLPSNWSGDSLTFTTGPQWIVHTAGRWSPHAHLRMGGQKVTELWENPKLRTLLSQLPPGTDPSKYYDLYTRHWETTGFSLSAGGGLDVALNRALAVRVAGIDYTRSWLGDINGRRFDQGLALSTGLVLRIGTW